jgi:hypothetical protein
MNWFKRYQNQNAKGFKGLKRLWIQDITNLKWRIHYIWKKHVEYPVKGL